MNDEATSTPINLAGSIEFAAWPTVVENDDLALGRLNFDVGSPLISFPSGKNLALTSNGSTQRHVLEATFISVEKEMEIRFSSNDVIAFRVLDESGLVDLWHASQTGPRPGRTTFRATGHKWTDESFLVFLGDGEKPRFSYFVATNDLCLELVCYSEPLVEVLGPALVKSSSNGS